MYLPKLLRDFFPGIGRSYDVTSVNEVALKGVNRLLADQTEIQQRANREYDQLISNAVLHRWSLDICPQFHKK